MTSIAPFFVWRCCFAAQKRGGERPAGDLAHLQAHEAGETRRARSSAYAPAQVLTGHLLAPKGQNGPAQADGQRKHHYGYGQGTLRVYSS